MPRKQIQSSASLIKKMETNQGITFNYIKSKEAEVYLKNVNNYFRTACYRKNFEKTSYGKYINLDFLHLTELSTLDMHYRYIIYKMCLDIEHSLKVSLVLFFEVSTNISINNEYTLVKNFLDIESNRHVHRDIKIAKSSNSYLSNLTNKYFTFDDNGNLIRYDDCPAWVLVEILSFGNFINFFYYCQEYNSSSILNNTDLMDQKNIINLVKKLRNGAAHNNCIFENLRTGSSISPRILVDRIYSSDTLSLNRSYIRNRLSVRPVLELTALLFLYNDIVSDKIKYHRISEFKKLFFVRMLEKENLMNTNELLVANYKFVKIIINYLF